MTPTNEERAERVYAKIDGYADNDGLEECIIDILTDLHHLCTQEEISFLDCYLMARSHFEEETNEQG